jgi:putative endonuclease
MPSWFVYFLKSTVKNFVYVGFTHDLDRRMSQHTKGFVKSTKAYRPLELMAYVAVRTERKARELEKYFKKGSGKAILKKRILAEEAPS